MIDRRFFRQIRRYRAIGSILARHGLGFLAHHLGLRLARAPSPAVAGDIGVRIRRALEELGPTFIKMGQIASTRADLVPPEILRELQKLQDRVPPVPFAEIEAVLKSELGPDRYAAFASIETEPLATASIGQVHAARLQSGEEVVIKVQRPNVHQVITDDLSILRGLAALASKHSPLAQWYDFRQAAEDIALTLLRELDYLREASHAQRLRQARQQHIYVPRVYWEYTTSRVLTMERLHGQKLSSEDGLNLDVPARKTVARQLVEGILEQILIHGFFHADPHPGNIMVLHDGRIGLLDFGIMGRLDETTRRYLAEGVLHLLRGNDQGLLRTIKHLLNPPESTDWTALRNDLEDLRERFYRRPFRQLELSGTVQEFFALLRRHHLRIPAGLTLVGKTLITLEGVALELDPDLSITELAKPLGTKLLRLQLSPDWMSRRVLDELELYGQPLLQLPALLRDFLHDAREAQRAASTFKEEWQAWQKNVARTGNRLSLSILLLAVSILVTGMAIAGAMRGVDAWLWGLPVIEASVALLLLGAAVLLWSMFRSGGP